MNTFDRLETLAQRLVEGSFSWLWPLWPDRSTIARPKDGQDHREETAEIRLPRSAGATGWLLEVGARRLQLGEPVISLGRALDNDVILDDPTVSRYHAQLRWRGERYYLCPPAGAPRPVGHPSAVHPWPAVSPELLAASQAPVIERPLASGDVIQLGQTVIRVLTTPDNS